MTAVINARYQLDTDVDPAGDSDATCLLTGRRVRLHFAGPNEALRGRASRVLHPRLLEVLETASVEEGPPGVLRRGFWVSEEPPGPALAGLLERGQTFSDVELQRLADTALVALDALHRVDSVARLDPANLYLDERRAAVLATPPDAPERPADARLCAPEVARGGPPSARSDLYTLGAVLYLAASGRAPEGATTAPLTELRADLDPCFARLIHRLLELDPLLRPDHAGAARALLHPGTPPAAPALRLQPPFQGRTVAWEAIESACEEARLLAAAGRAAREQAPTAQPTLIVIRGAPGVGRSRLLHEASSALARRAALPLLGRAHPGGGAYASWVSLLRLAALRASAELQPACDAALAALQGSDQPVAVRHEAVARFLLELGRQQPVVLLVDDAEHFGESSSELLVHVARSARSPDARGALAIVVASDLSHTSALDDALGAPLVPPLRELTLQSLAPAEASALVQAYVQDAERVREITSRGGGNPALLTELVIARARGGETPTSVRQAVEQRVAELSEAARGLLVHLALLGRPLARAHASDLVGDAGELAEVQAELVEDGLVQADDTSLSLPHRVLGEVVLEGLDADARQQACARILEALGDAAAPGERARLALTAGAPDAVELALAVAPRDPSPARLYLAVARQLEPGPKKAEALLEASRASNDAEASQRAAADALEHADAASPLLRARIQLQLALLAERAGDRDATREHADAGRALLSAKGDAVERELLAELLAARARVATLQSEHKTALELLGIAHTLVAPDAHVLRAQLFEDEGMALVLSLDRTQYARAKSLLEQAVELLEDHGDPRRRAEAQRKLGNHAFYAGRYADAEASFRRGLELCAELGYLEEQAGLWNNLGYALREQGRLREAEGALLRALDAAERVGLGSVMCRALVNVGRVRLSLDDPLGATRSLRRAARIAHQLHEQHIETAALSELGRARLAQGRTQAALDAYRRSLHVRLRLGDPGRVAESELELGELWRKSGDVWAALGCMTRGMALTASLGASNGVATAVEALEFCAGRPGGPATVLVWASRNLRLRGPGEVSERLAEGRPLPRLALHTLAAATTARAGEVDRALIHTRQAQTVTREIQGGPLAGPVKTLAQSLALEATAAAHAARGELDHARGRLERALDLHPQPRSVRRGALLLKLGFLALAQGAAQEAVDYALASEDPPGLPEPLRERRAIGRALIVANARRRAEVTVPGAVISLSKAQAVARRLGDVALLAFVSATRADAARAAGNHAEADWESAAAAVAASRLTRDLPEALVTGLEAAVAPGPGPGSGALVPTPSGPSTVHEVVRRALEPERFARALLDVAREQTAAPRGWVAFAAGGEFELQVSHGIDDLTPHRGVPARVVDPWDLPDADEESRAADLGAKSLLAVPIAARSKVLGVLYLDHHRRAGAFPREIRDAVFGLAAGVAEPLRGLLDDSAKDRARVRRASAARETAHELDAAEIKIVGTSPAIRTVLRLIERYGPTSAPVTIHGESGTGKELVAKSLHRASDRRGGPFVALNCSALTDTLLESELFGVIKGAFTGADRDRPGLFELAHQGSLFMDEVADMSLDMQAKLLRVLETGELRPVGGRRLVKVDVRVISASHRDLREGVAKGSFREDLYYRLNVLRVELPPLRERRADIPALVAHFLEELARERGEAPKRLTPQAMEHLMRHPLPGNVRELRNALARACVLSVGDELTPEQLLLEVATQGPPAAASRQQAPAYRKDFDFQGARLNHRQRQALEVFSTGRTLTNRDYCGLVDVSERTGLRDLSDLVKQGVLERLGKRKGARYRLANTNGGE